MRLRILGGNKFRTTRPEDEAAMNRWMHDAQRFRAVAIDRARKDRTCSADSSCFPPHWVGVPPAFPKKSESVARNQPPIVRHVAVRSWPGSIRTVTGPECPFTERPERRNSCDSSNGSAAGGPECNKFLSSPCGQSVTTTVVSGNSRQFKTRSISLGRVCVIQRSRLSRATIIQP